MKKGTNMTHQVPVNSEGSAQESPRNGKTKMAFISSVAGLITTAMLIPWGSWVTVSVFRNSQELAVLRSQASNTEGRVQKIEIDGSNGLQKHESKDDERVDAMNKRLSRVEDATAALSRIESVLIGIQKDIEWMKRTAPVKIGPDGKPTVGGW